MQPDPRIYEDPDSNPSSTPRSERSHKRFPSVGDVLRGRRNREVKPPADQRPLSPTQNPLRELRINSPPQRVPIKDGEGRPQLHKKTNSSVSIKSFMKNKDKVVDSETAPSTDGRSENQKPRKSKSSTNLSGLLKKKSKKDLQAESPTRKEAFREDKPLSPVKALAPTPIWAQFATQPIEGGDGRLYYPGTNARTLEEEIKMYTPRDCLETGTTTQRNFYDIDIPAERLPQRPFLEHKSSRSSIFTENMDDEGDAELRQPKSRDKTPSRPSASRHESHTSEAEPPIQTPTMKRGSRVLEVINTFNLRSGKDQCRTPKMSATNDDQLSPQELDSVFEQVLDRMDIPANMRDGMRNLKPEVKAGLVKGERIGSASSTVSIPFEHQDVRSSARSPAKAIIERPSSQDDDCMDGKRPRSRSRPRSIIASMSRRDEGSPKKKSKAEQGTRSRSKSRPKSIDVSRTNLSKAMSSTTSLGNLTSPDSASTPGDFIHYLREVQKPELVEVGKLHKLRILLRNESVAWTDTFVTKGGMDEVVQLLYRIIKIEWREEHEDNLLHETLLCMKGLCTTSLAVRRLEIVQDEFFPTLLAMLFDEERKGPSEFSTRGVIMSLLFAYLSAAVQRDPEELKTRARTILGYLRDPAPKEEKQPLGFISQMHIPRPYRVWCKELVNVTKEVFWIFLHNMNVVPIISTEGTGTATFAQQHFPAPRPPHPAAPYVGGVEWEATQYISTHLDVINGILASLPTRKERNDLREDMRQSGFEKAMGGTLRTCKEKFYGAVHDGLKVWVAAAQADGWYVEDVRAGPPREASPKKSPVKKKGDEAPKIAFEVGADSLPKMDDVWV